MVKKVKFTERQIKMIAEAEALKLKNPVNEGIEDILGKHLGDDEDKKIEYPSQDDLEGSMSSSDTEMDGDDTIKVTDMKGASELLGYLDKLEEAKSVLSKIAAKEDNDNIKSRIYVHYEKTQKLIFELIKEFGIVH
jgi:hypothetical protein